jgi:G:T/U-mismatch repair DNA glycosylase
MEFYYPNFQNDMRRMLGLIFHHDKSFFIAPNGKQFDAEKAKKFCEENKMGIGDTAEQIIRLQGNAADDKLQIVKPANIEKILEKIPECHTLVVTGQKAMETLRFLIDFPQPKI